MRARRFMQFVMKLVNEIFFRVGKYCLMSKDSFTLQRSFDRRHERSGAFSAETGSNQA